MTCIIIYSYLCCCSPHSKFLKLQEGGTIIDSCYLCFIALVSEIFSEKKNQDLTVPVGVLKKELGQKGCSGHPKKKSKRGVASWDLNQANQQPRTGTEGVGERGSNSRWESGVGFLKGSGSSNHHKITTVILFLSQSCLVGGREWPAV